MNLDMVDTKKNPLMKREEYEISIDHAGKPTPSRQEILKEIAKKTGKKEELIIVDRIFTDAGKSVSKIRALTYSKTEDIPKGKIEKMKSRAKKKAAPAAGAVESGEKPEAETNTAEEKSAEAEEGKTKEAPKEESVSEESKPEETKPEAPAEEKPADNDKPAEPKADEKKP